MRSLNLCSWVNPPPHKLPAFRWQYRKLRWFLNEWTSSFKLTTISSQGHQNPQLKYACSTPWGAFSFGVIHSQEKSIIKSIRNTLCSNNGTLMLSSRLSCKTPHDCFRSVNGVSGLVIVALCVRLRFWLVTCFYLVGTVFAIGPSFWPTNHLRFSSLSNLLGGKCRRYNHFAISVISGWHLFDSLPQSFLKFPRSRFRLLSSLLYTTETP